MNDDMISSQIVGIGCASGCVSIHSSELTFIVAVSSSVGDLRGLSSNFESWPEVATAETKLFRIKLPRGASQRDVLDEVHAVGAQERDDPGRDATAECLHRTISDIVLWELFDIDFAETPRPIVLVSGQLLPKLRGRLFYRWIDVSVPMLFVHSRSGDLVNSLGPMKTVTPTRLAISGPSPSPAIDAPSRRFEVDLESGLLVVEIPANTLDDGSMHFAKQAGVDAIWTWRAGGVESGGPAAGDCPWVSWKTIATTRICGRSSIRNATSRTAPHHA